jgi:hypothetical protein
MSLYVSVPNIEAFEHLSKVQQNSAELGQQPILGLYSLRYYTEELRFHLKKRKYLAQTEIVSALSGTRFPSAQLGTVFHWERGTAVVSGLLTSESKFIQTAPLPINDPGHASSSCFYLW